MTEVIRTSISDQRRPHQPDTSDAPQVWRRSWKRTGRLSWRDGNDGAVLTDVERERAVGAGEERPRPHGGAADLAGEVAELLDRHGSFVEIDAIHYLSLATGALEVTDTLVITHGGGGDDDGR